MQRFNLSLVYLSSLNFMPSKLKFLKLNLKQTLAMKKFFPLSYFLTENFIIRLFKNIKHPLSKMPILLGIFFVFSIQNATAQAVVTTTDTAKYVKNPKPSLKATRIAKPPKIDGNPIDDCWKDLPIADDFIMHRPQPYKKSPFRTEFKIAYDRAAEEGSWAGFRPANMRAYSDYAVA